MIKDQVAISPKFRLQAKKAVASIILFILVYFILMAASLALTLSCLYFGLNLIIGYPSFITIILGIGIIALGSLIFVFLIKFIFSTKKIDRSGLIEIKASDEPKLFAMINDIVEQVGTDFPKKVFLSADVNAAVFFNSNFWSMFFPIRKNLMIGLGLINSVTDLELKAILAHEFGHFSQDSMKVGSYVYNVNQVIHNMLYDNEGFEKLVVGLGNISGYVGIFVVLAIKIINLIQWVLQKLYELINKNYMGLSREMEFQADEIAAHVTGYKPLANSLLRLDLAQHGYTSVLNFYEQKLKENIKSENIYLEHHFINNFLAKENDLQFEYGFPKVTVESLNKYNRSKLVVKDQWSSHPSTEDRINRLKTLKLEEKIASDIPANQLFNHLKLNQEKMTNILFSVKEFEKASFINLKDFETDYQKIYKENSFEKVYKEYFDFKNIETFDVDEVDYSNDLFTLEDLISLDKQEVSFEYLALMNDIESLNFIKQKESQIKTFDYDGKKYKKKECVDLINTLEKKLEQAKENVKQNDVNIYQFFLNKEKQKNENQVLTTLYKDYFKFGDSIETKMKALERMQNSLNFLNEVHEHNVILSKFTAFKTLEKIFKENISALLNNEKFIQYCDDDMLSRFNKYLLKDYYYFLNDHYVEPNLEMLFNAINDYSILLNKAYFKQKQGILSYQASLL